MKLLYTFPSFHPVFEKKMMLNLQLNNLLVSLKPHSHLRILVHEDFGQDYIRNCKKIVSEKKLSSDLHKSFNVIAYMDGDFVQK